MILSSPAFQNNAPIPTKYTCDGQNINPPLEISAVPENARSLVLIADDPDSPSGTWTHWTLWNIDPKTKNIPENSAPTKAEKGITDFNTIGYGGPCPHSGTHRYFFKLYALDTTLELPPQTNKTRLEEAMQNHILDQAELMGLYHH